MVWALAMVATALVGLYAEGWQTPAKVRDVAVIYLVGALIAFPPALWLARVLSLGKPRDVACAAFFLALAVATIGITAAIYALDYRSYYTQWHAPAFSKSWTLQFVFTIAGALYQFAVLGLRLYMPLGLVALLVAALWFARQPR